MAFWPTSVATDANLYVAVNSLETTLSAAIDNVVTTVPLTDISRFPTAGAIAIDLEVIFYTGISGSSLTGCTRGADGTSAASHLILAPAAAAIVAFHHNGLMYEIEAIEQYLSTYLGLSTPTANRVIVSNGTGTLTTSTVTDTELSYLSGVTSAIQTQLNGKQATLTIGNLTDAGTDGITVTGGTGAVIGSGTSLSQHIADATHNGYLSSTDWSTFNSKLSSITTGNLTDAGTDGITVSNGTSAVIGTGTSISQHVADSTHNGYLSSTDWSTFSAGATGVVHIAGTETITGSKTFSAALAAFSGSSIYQNSTASTLFSIINGVTGGGAYSAQLTLSTDQSSTGDPFIEFTNGLVPWSIGEDNSDSNKFKISNSATLGTNDFFAIAPTTGATTINGSVYITPTSNQLFLGPIGNYHTIITAPTPALNRTYTISDAGANASFVMTEGAQTINGAKTFGSAIIGSLTGGASLDLPLTGGTLTGELFISVAGGTNALELDGASAGTVALVFGPSTATANKASILGSASTGGTKTNLEFLTAGVTQLKIDGDLGNATFYKSVYINTSSVQLILGDTAGRKTIISAPTPASTRTYTIPDAGADASFVMTEGAQTINGAKTFGNSLILNSAETNTIYNGGATPTSGALLIGQNSYWGLRQDTAHAINFDVYNGGTPVTALKISNGGVVSFQGTTTNDDAPSGYVGEYISSILSSGSATSISNGVAKSVTSIAITAGDWDVHGLVGYIPGTGTSTSQVGQSISTVNNTLGAETTVTYDEINSGASGNVGRHNTGYSRISVSGATTLWLVSTASFTGGTMTVFGQISARRAR